MSVLLNKQGFGKKRKLRTRVAYASEEQKERAEERTLASVALAIGVCYYLVAIVAYSYNVERISVRDAMYFATVTMTTAGFGDIAPTSRHSRVFTTFFAAIGVCIVAACVGQLAQYAMMQREALMAQTKKAIIMSEGDGDADKVEEPALTPPPQGVLRSLSSSVDSNDRAPLVKGGGGAKALGSSGGRGGSPGKVVSGGLKGGIRSFKKAPPSPSFKKAAAASDLEANLATASGDEAPEGAPPLQPMPHPFAHPCGPCAWVSWLFTRFPVLWVVGLMAVYALVAGLLYSSLEDDWTLIDGVYYAVISGTSVGYGDFAPKSHSGRWLTVVWLPFSIMFMGAQLGKVGSCIFDSDSEAKLADLLNLDLSIQGMLDMDEDGDGDITEFEFLKFMLVKCDMADDAVLDSLHKRFLVMDTDGSGALSRDDLVSIIDQSQGEPCGVVGSNQDVPASDVESLLLEREEAFQAFFEAELSPAARLQVQKQSSSGSFKGTSIDAFRTSSRDALPSTPILRPPSALKKSSGGGSSSKGGGNGNRKKAASVDFTASSNGSSDGRSDVKSGSRSDVSKVSVRVEEHQRQEARKKSLEDEPRSSKGGDRQQQPETQRQRSLSEDKAGSLEQHAPHLVVGGRPADLLRDNSADSFVFSVSSVSSSPRGGVVGSHPTHSPFVSADNVESPKRSPIGKGGGRGSRVSSPGASPVKGKGRPGGKGGRPRPSTAAFESDHPLI